VYNVSAVNCTNNLMRPSVVKTSSCELEVLDMSFGHLTRIHRIVVRTITRVHGACEIHVALLRLHPQ
jgi:hypothetical protein